MCFLQLGMLRLEHNGCRVWSAAYKSDLCHLVLEFRCEGPWDVNEECVGKTPTVCVSAFEKDYCFVSFVVDS